MYVEWSPVSHAQSRPQLDLALLPAFPSTPHVTTQDEGVQLAKSLTRFFCDASTQLHGKNQSPVCGSSPSVSIDSMVLDSAEICKTRLIIPSTSPAIRVQI